MRTDRDCITVAGLPDQTRQRVRARLINAALATTAARLGMDEVSRESVQ
jgi:hypothetical protein